MPLLENLKHGAELITGVSRPDPADIKTRRRKPHALWLKDDGETPNNPHFPFTLYRTPVALAPGYDPAAIFEVLFGHHGWTGSWRDGVYDFLHFHTRTHEVLGISRGKVRVQFGGARGCPIELKAGDVAILPAGTGHRCLRASRDLLVVGAYPADGSYNEPKPAEISRTRARDEIKGVPVPQFDPVYGRDGPMFSLWNSSAEHRFAQKRTHGQHAIPAR